MAIKERLVVCNERKPLIPPCQTGRRGGCPSSEPWPTPPRLRRLTSADEGCGTSSSSRSFRSIPAHSGRLMHTATHNPSTEGQGALADAGLSAPRRSSFPPGFPPSPGAERKRHRVARARESVLRRQSSGRASETNPSRGAGASAATAIPRVAGWTLRRNAKGRDSRPRKTGRKHPY